MTPVHQRKPTDCAGLQMLLHLYVDDELVGEDKRDVEGHLAHCASCQADRDRLLGLKHSLRSLAQDDVMPAKAKASVHAAVGRARRTERTRKSLLVAATVAVLLAVGGVGYWAVSTTQSPVQQQQLAEWVVAVHHLDVPVDLATPDRARAERYLKKRMGTPVQVPSLDARGFGLRGARVVGIGDHPSAQLVYMGHLGQRLSVVVLPDEQGRIARRAGLRDVPQPVTGGGEVTLLMRAPDAVMAATGDVDDDTLYALFER